MPKMIIRLIANVAILVGFFLLARMIYDAVYGSISAQFFPESKISLTNTMVALFFGLPVPVHVISIGLLLQRRWLPHSWARISFLAVAISGCWLGAALGIKLFVFH